MYVDCAASRMIAYIRGSVIYIAIVYVIYFNQIKLNAASTTKHCSLYYLLTALGAHNSDHSVFTGHDS